MPRKKAQAALSPRPSILTPVDPVIPVGAVKLAQLADALARGESCNITRLTVLKSLCKNPRDAQRFVAYLLWRKFPNPTEVPGRPAEKELFQRGLAEIHRRLTAPPSQAYQGLWRLFHEIEGSQGETKPTAWGAVRLIDNSSLLLVEFALGSFLPGNGAPFWAYRCARLYCERYDSRYGTGLIPESAPFVRDVADFWGAGSAPTLPKVGVKRTKPRAQCFK